MEGAGNLDMTTLAAIGGWIITVVVLLGGVMHRLARLTSRFDRLERRFDERVAENAKARREPREEFRRNHQQSLQAPVRHAHGPDTGFALSALRWERNNPAAETAPPPLLQDIN